MISLVWAGIRAHWLNVIGLSLVAGIVGTLGVQHLEVIYLRSELSRCHAENTTLEQSNKALTQSVENQNAAYALLQAQMEAKKKEAAALHAQAEADIAKKALLLQRIRLGKPSGNVCADMHAALNRYFIGVQP